MSDEIIRKAAAYLRSGVGHELFIRTIGDEAFSELVERRRSTAEGDRQVKIDEELAAGRPLLAYVGFKGWRLHLVVPVKDKPDRFRAICGRLCQKWNRKDPYVSVHATYFQGEHDKQADCPACLREQKKRESLR